MKMRMRMRGIRGSERFQFQSLNSDGVLGQSRFSTVTNNSSTSPRKAARKRPEGRAPMRVQGAPGIADIKKFFEEDGSRFQQLLEGLLERKPELLLYYLAGKPVEHVEHSGGVIVGLSEEVLARARDYAQD